MSVARLVASFSLEEAQLLPLSDRNAFSGLRVSSTARCRALGSSLGGRSAGGGSDAVSIGAARSAPSMPTLAHPETSKANTIDSRRMAGSPPPPTSDADRLATLAQEAVARFRGTSEPRQGKRTDQEVVRPELGTASRRTGSSPGRNQGARSSHGVATCLCSTHQSTGEGDNEKDCVTD